ALYLRRLDDDDGHLIAGTKLDVSTPVFSPDGHWLAFWSARDSTFKKIGIGGGAPVTLGRSGNPRGAAWFRDLLVIGAGAGGIVSVPATGGHATVWIAPDRGEMLRSPQVLPDGDAILFVAATVTGNRTTHTDAVVYSRVSRRRTLLIPNARAARYIADDAIAYAIGTTLCAGRIDRRSHRLVGDPVPIADNVDELADFDASSDGTLVYVPASGRERVRRLTIVGSSGGSPAVEKTASTVQNP